MARTDDRVFAHLLVKLHRLPADRVAAVATDAEARGALLVDVATAASLVTAEEAIAYAAAVRHLVVGNHVRACVACRLQVYAPAEPPRRCGQCGGALRRGILPAPKTIAFDPELERQIRRLVLDTMARQTTRDRVTIVRRMRDEGRVGRRNEEDLAPKAASIQESILGPYRLLGLAGRGSSTYVYRAEDTRTGQGVALKVLYFHQGETPAEVTEKVARFKREADLASRLEHPHLLTVGTLEQTGPWYHFAMPFVDGPTLAQLIEARHLGAEGASPGGGRSDLRAMLNALADVARGLHYAHCQGVIHRDVNPRNILFSMAGQAFLSDFGAAKPLDSLTRLTGAKAVLGAREYAAPERLVSETRADARSDIYSLGLVLFEVLTGRLPFPRSEAELESDRARFSGPPSARAFNPDVPPSLDSIARKAMEKDPARRYASALEFAQALSDCLAEEETAIGTAAEADAAAPVDRPAGPIRRLAYMALSFAFGLAAMALSVPSTGPDPAALLATVDREHARMTTAALPADYDTARHALRRALEQAEAGIGLASPEVEFRKGRFAWSQGNLPETIARMDKAVAAKQSGPAARATAAAAAWLLAERHRDTPAQKEWMDRARPFVQGLPNEPADSYAARFGSALRKLLAEDRDGAHAGLRDLVRSSPERDEAGLLYGRLALGLRNAEQAAAALDAVHAAHPWQPLVLSAWALALADHGRAKEVSQKALDAQTLWPDVADLPLAEGIALEKQGLTPRAVLAYGRAARLDPAAPEPLRRLAPLRETDGDRCRALAAHARILELDPRDGDSRYHRGRLLLVHGDPVRGKMDLREYLAEHAEGPFATEARRLLEGR